MYIREADNYPCRGRQTDTFFWAEKLFCRIFSGSKVEKSKKTPVESSRAGKFTARNPADPKNFRSKFFRS